MKVHFTFKANNSSLIDIHIAEDLSVYWRYAEAKGWNPNHHRWTGWGKTNLRPIYKIHELQKEKYLWAAYQKWCEEKQPKHPVDIY
jgi:hypothetical protein